MRNIGLPVAGAMSIASLLSLGGYLLPVSAIAQTRPTTPVYTPGSPLPRQTIYDCGNAGVITLTRHAKNLDRFTYRAVNTKGQKLIIRNGTGYASPERAVYTFYQKDAAFIVDQELNGKATLTTTGKGVKSTDFSCKLTKVIRSAPRK